MEIARASLVEAGKSPRNNPKFFKYGEQKSNEVMRRLEHFERSVDSGDRDAIAVPKAKVTEIHDAWLEGIMSKHK